MSRRAAFCESIAFTGFCLFMAATTILCLALDGNPIPTAQPPQAVAPARALARHPEGAGAFHPDAIAALLARN